LAVLYKLVDIAEKKLFAVFLMSYNNNS